MILSPRMGLGETSVPSSVPLLREDLLPSSHPDQLPVSTHPGKPGGPWHWHDPIGVMQTLGMEPQTSSSWSGSVPHPSGGEEHPRRGMAAASPRKKGAQGCFQRKRWHKEQVLEHSMALRPGKSPVPSSGLAWGRGDGAAAVGPGTGRVSDGSPGQPGPAGFKVTCKAQSGRMPSLPHGWRHLGLLFTSPELQTPGKGSVVLPTPMAAAQLAGDGAPAPTHALPHTLAPV